jgi:hypothetical protein
MTKKIRSTLLCALLYQAALHAQVTGGQHVFKFLSLSPGARITALGGAQIAVRDDDPVFAAQNPAALNPLMNGRASFNHNFYLSDVQTGYVAYAHHLPKWGFTVQGGLQYMNYGDIQQADDQGNLSGGKVHASETAFTLGAARPLSERFSLGLNLRLGLSALDMYRSSALLSDAGILYADTSRRITAALVIRNAGAQMSTYNGIREDLPFDVQFGISKRLKYLPFRISIIAHHLHQWNIRYDDPNFQDEDVLLFGEPSDNSGKGNSGVDNFFRHLIFNGEFLLGRNEGFRIRLGYNHLRKRELSVRNYRSLAGFSAGVGIKINRFRLDMGYGAFHLAGSTFHLGIGTYLFK